MDTGIWKEVRGWTMTSTRVHGDPADAGVCTVLVHDGATRKSWALNAVRVMRVDAMHDLALLDEPKKYKYIMTSQQGS